MNGPNLPLLFKGAAEITAAAVYELFPSVEVLEAKASSTGFVCDLYFPHPVHPQTISMIEEQIRQVVREKRPIRTLEMVPVSAQGLLRSLGFQAQAERLEGEGGLIELVQIGSFHNLSSGPHLKNTAELAAFKLLSIECLEDRVIRIQGCASGSKKELRDYLRKRDQYSNHCHEKLGAGLWVDVEGRIVWQGQGLRLRHEIIEFLKRHLFVGATEVAGSYFEGDRSLFHSEILKKIGGAAHSVAEFWTRFREEEGIDEGLFGIAEEGIVQVSAFSRTEDLQGKLISSLQSIGKTLNILGFNYCLKVIGRKATEKGFLEFLRAVKSLERSPERQGLASPERQGLQSLERQGLQSPEKQGLESPERQGLEVLEEEGKASQVEFLIEDALGRKWPAVLVRRPKAQGGVKENSSYIIEASVEKITALLIERYLLKMNCKELIDMMVGL